MILSHPFVISTRMVSRLLSHDFAPTYVPILFVGHWHWFALSIFSFDLWYCSIPMRKKREIEQDYRYEKGFEPLVFALKTRASFLCRRGSNPGHLMLRGDIFHCNKFQLGSISSWEICYNLISIWVNRLELILCIWYWTWLLFSLISSCWLSSCYAYMSICDWKFVMCIWLWFIISR